jgi:hypothetical protein
MPRKKHYETKSEYDNYYMNYAKDRLNCLMEKGTKDRIKLACDKEGIKSTNEFIKQAIEEKLFRCGIEKQITIKDPELSPEEKEN